MRSSVASKQGPVFTFQVAPEHPAAGDPYSSLRVSMTWSSSAGSVPLLLPLLSYFKLFLRCTETESYINFSFSFSHSRFSLWSSCSSQVGSFNPSLAPPLFCCQGEKRLVCAFKSPFLLQHTHFESTLYCAKSNQVFAILSAHTEHMHHIHCAATVHV